MSSFQDKNILVVGGSSGIGLALTKRLAAAGANVMVASRTKPEGVDVTHIPMDVLNGVGDALQDLPDVLHGLAYCPGTITLKPFNRLKEEDLLHDYQVNVVGAFRVLQAAYKALKKADGASVVLFSTVAVNVGMGFHASIAAAKGSLAALGRALAAEWAPSHVRVNMVAPSLVDTPLAKDLLASDDRRESSNKRHPLGRVGTPEDIAAMAEFLLSDDATWVTGQVLGVDGGMSTLK